MQSLGQYILSVGLAALVVAIIAEFSDQKSATGTMIRMVCGLFLAFTAINPITKLNLGILETFSEQFFPDTSAAVSAGTDLAEESIHKIIKQKTQAYILDKAHSFGCSPEVEVTLGEGPAPVPESVCVTGEIPFSARKELEKFLEQELGISKENQQWIG